jgi:uncharacterized protein
MTANPNPAGAIDHNAYPPGYLRTILERARTIAVVGASPEPWRPSYGIMAYLKRHGYRVVAINPHAVGQMVRGEPFHKSLERAPYPVDLVNVFRRPDAVPAVVEDAIAIKAPSLWMQIGVRHDAAAARAEAAGIAVVMNRCISVEHARLLR